MQLMQMWQMMQGSQNPMGIMQSMCGNNPAFANLQQLINGKGPQQLEQIARNMARERGVNIDAIMVQMGLKK